MVGEVPQMASMISILEFQVNFPCWRHLVYCDTNLKEKTISILFVFFFRGTQDNTSVSEVDIHAINREHRQIQDNYSFILHAI